MKAKLLRKIELSLLSLTMQSANSSMLSLTKTFILTSDYIDISIQVKITLTGLRE